MKFATGNYTATILALAALIVCDSSWCCLRAAEPDGAIVFKDIDGRDHGWSDNSKLTTVLVFINTDCPIANFYHPALSEMKEDFSDKNVDCVLIHANPLLTEKQARAHIKEYDIRCSVALDPGQEIARFFMARVTPEAFVVDAEGRVRYRGRIDDQHAAFGKKRPKASREDLRIALQEVLSGKPVTEKDTKAIGCLIRFPK